MILGVPGHGALITGPLTLTEIRPNVGRWKQVRPQQPEDSGVTAFSAAPAH